MEQDDLPGEVSLGEPQPCVLSRYWSAEEEAVRALEAAEELLKRAVSPHQLPALEAAWRQRDELRETMEAAKPGEDKAKASIGVLFQNRLIAMQWEALAAAVRERRRKRGDAETKEAFDRLLPQAPTLPDLVMDVWLAERAHDHAQVAKLEAALRRRGGGAEVANLKANLRMAFNIPYPLTDAEFDDETVKLRISRCQSSWFALLAAWQTRQRPDFVWEFAASFYVTAVWLASHYHDLGDFRKAAFFLKQAANACERAGFNRLKTRVEGWIRDKTPVTKEA